MTKKTPHFHHHFLHLRDTDTNVTSLKLGALHVYFALFYRYTCIKLGLLETTADLEVHNENDGRAQPQNHEVQEQAVPKLLPADRSKHPSRLVRHAPRVANVRVRAQQRLSLRFQVFNYTLTYPFRLLQDTSGIQEAQAAPVQKKRIVDIWICGTCEIFFSRGKDKSNLEGQRLSICSAKLMRP